MLTSEQVMHTYESMASLSAQMLAAASAGDWEHLASLEERCAAQIRALQNHEAALAASGSDRARKVALIRAILANDRQIRELTTPWMTRLSALISNTRTQNRLAGAYGGA